MKYVVIYFIKLYQRIPFRCHNYCKFQPTCSNCAIGVLLEFGLFKGMYLSIKRILKCNRFSKGGYDPIPLNGGKNEKN